MDKIELKNAKKAYKRALLLENEESRSALAEQLRQEMALDEWTAFEEEAGAFRKKVEALAEEVAQKAADRTNIMVPEALAPYLEQAKALGNGAQIYIQDVYARVAKKREEMRAAEKKLAKKARRLVGEMHPPPRTATPAEKRQVIYPSLPSDWVDRNVCKPDGSPAASRLGTVMLRYCRVSLRPLDSSKMDRLHDLELQAKFTAGSQAEYEDAMARAQAWLRCAIPVARDAIARRGDTPEQAEVMRRLGHILQGYVEEQREKAEKHRKSVKARETYKVSIPLKKHIVAQTMPLPLLEDAPFADESPLSVPSVHPNDIATLAPGTSWTVYLDESYYGDADSAFQTDGNGVIAGVICRDDNPLPPQPCLHCATDYSLEKLEAQDNVVAELLNHPNCGVLAVPSSAYDVAMGWDDVMAAWVDVVIRLLPFPEGEDKVTIRVCVEPRYPYRTEEDFRALTLVCENSLKNSFPERARRVRLSFVPLPKPQPGVKSGNAYPDIISFTCFRHETDNTARQRYKKSGWSGVCHLDIAPDRLSRILRCFHRCEPLDSAAWSAIVAHGQVGIVGALARQFGERARCAPAEWERYLDFLYEHLMSGAINMKLLRRQVAWMATFLPAEIPKKTRLRWLVAQIALANHEGKNAALAGSPLRAEFDALCEELFDEKAPLVCEATLHLAVAYTNCYEFEMALALIQSLLGRDCAAVGLAARGKLLSTEGQHLAFLGMGDEAIMRFREALGCFARLSDTTERTINTDITRAYLATATMDTHPANARRALALYLLGDENATEDALAREVACLAVNREKKFHHHILLRYIVAQPNDDPLRQAYLDAYEQWCDPSVGHPWELVEFYRAVLLPSSSERTRRLETAYRLAIGERGETLMVIAAVIAGVALSDGLGGEWPECFKSAVSQIGEMPGLKENGRYQALLDQPTAKLPPLELAAKVLPFNFR